MNALKTLLVALLFASAFPAFGLVANHRRAAAIAGRAPAAAVDSALLSRIARAQAAVALAQSSGAATRLPPGF